MRVRPGARSLVAVVALTSLIASGCSIGPSDRPDFALEEQSPGSAVTEPETPDTTVDELSPPVVDLLYTDCSSMLLTQWDLPALPDGVTLRCGTFPAPMDPTDPSLPTDLSVGVVVARSSATPEDAAPIVYTSGADRPSTAAVAELATQPNNALLAEHPVVGIDRRGIGTSFPLMCLDPTDRETLLNLGQFTPGDPIDAVATASRNMTVDCGDVVLQSAEDYIPPGRMVFRASDAAADIEHLRDFWGIPTIGLIGSGNGARVALAYAAAHPDAVGRLILDGPPTSDGDALTNAEFRVRGQEAALNSFAQRCVAISCSLGGDPRSRIIELLDRAGNGQLRPLSRADVAGALLMGLGDLSTADQATRTRELADAVNDALNGNTRALADLSDLYLANTGSDGQFASRCSDGYQWTPADRVRTLVNDWTGLYPAFGPTEAVNLLACTAWPADNPPEVPSELGVPVMVTTGVADPTVGDAGIPGLTGTLNAAGAATAVATWQGLGHPPLSSSSCIREAAASYLETGELPPDGTACPP